MKICFWEKSLFLIEQGFFICVKIYKRCCILNKRCYICTQITIKNKNNDTECNFNSYTL